MKPATDRNEQSTEATNHKRKASDPIGIAKAEHGRRRKNTAPDPRPQNPESGTERDTCPAPTHFDPEKQSALELLATGSSVTALMRSPGYSRSSFYQWRDADSTFKYWGKRARGIQVADTDAALHELDTDARARNVVAGAVAGNRGGKVRSILAARRPGKERRDGRSETSAAVHIAEHVCRR